MDSTVLPGVAQPQEGRAPQPHLIPPFLAIPAMKNPAGETAGPKQIGNATMVNTNDSLGKAIQAGRQTIAPALARRILDEANYEHQRTTTPGALQKAMALVQGNDWVDGHQIWFARLFEGGAYRIYLVDGQHRLAAVWTSGLTRVFQVEVVDVATPGEVHNLYCRFNRFGRPRSNAELLESVRLAEELGIGKLTAGGAFKAMPYAVGNFATVRGGPPNVLTTDSEKIDAVRQWAPLVQAYDGYIRGADKDVAAKLRNPGLMAMALLTIRDQPATAHDFWSGVAADDGLRRNDPRHTLLAAFRTRTAVNSGGIEWARLAAGAWNAFYHKRPIGHIKVIPGAVFKIDGVRGLAR